MRAAVAVLLFASSCTGAQARTVHRGGELTLAAGLFGILGLGTCGGADAHGKTSQLTPAQVSDLVAYLETL